MTEEEIKQLKTENDQLRQAKQELTDNLASRESKIAELEKQVETANNETAAMQKKVNELDAGLNATRDSLGKTVAGYRSLTAHANPEIPAEMIIGDTLEAIEMAVAGARTIIGKVKEQLEAHAGQVHIPAGSPPRTSPDLSGLSTREKILRGIERK
jgi:chromosome segregation ATPase